MNGVHDVRGLHGFGPVVREPDEPTFHAAWEPRVQAMMSLASRARLLANANPAAADLDIQTNQHTVVLQNAPEVHHVVDTVGETAYRVR